MLTFGRFSHDNKLQHTATRWCLFDSCFKWRSVIFHTYMSNAATSRVKLKLCWVPTFYDKFLYDMLIVRFFINAISWESNLFIKTLRQGCTPRGLYNRPSLWVSSNITVQRCGLVFGPKDNLFSFRSSFVMSQFRKSRTRKNCVFSVLLLALMTTRYRFVLN